VDVTAPLTGPRSIHIVGGPGCGKTTLAGRVARALDVPVHDLDALAYRCGSRADYRPTYPLAARLRELGAITARPDWVAEGTHLWWTDALLRAAQLIVWLDVPWPLAFWRIVSRHLREVTADPRHRPRLRVLLGFLRWSWRYYHSADGAGAARADVDDVQAMSRAATASCLAPYADKVVRLRRPDDVEHWAVAITQPAAAPAGPTAN
jgi:adenylate kinase family enzyme